MVGGEGLRIEGLVPIEHVGHGLGHVQVEYGQDGHSADQLDQSLFTAA